MIAVQPEAVAPPKVESSAPNAAEAGPAVAPVAEPSADERAATPREAEAVSAPQSATRDTSAAPSDMPANSPAEIAAAEELLRDPAALGAWLAARGVDLAPDRREYAAAIVRAFAGHTVDTSAALERAAEAGKLEVSERRLVERIATGGSGEEMPVGASALARAACMKATEREAREHAASGKAREAAECYSRLLLAEIASPWSPQAGRLAAWSAGLHDAQQGNRWNRRGSWRSSEVVVQPGDSLIALRKRAVANDPALLVCTGQIARANQLDGEVIHPGAKLRIPLDPVSVLVDLDAHWAFYMAGDEVVAAWQVGVGKESSTTRVGTFTVGEKSEEPMWFPQGRKPVPYGDPENPLGTRWIAWNDGEGNATRLGFHGTNEPDSIGKDASLGCIRMRTADVEELFEILPRGATVRVVP